MFSCCDYISIVISGAESMPPNYIDINNEYILNKDDEEDNKWIGSYHDPDLGRDIYAYAVFDISLNKWVVSITDNLGGLWVFVADEEVSSRNSCPYDYSYSAISTGTCVVSTECGAPELEISSSSSSSSSSRYVLTLDGLLNLSDGELLRCINQSELLLRGNEILDKIFLVVNDSVVEEAEEKLASNIYISRPIRNFSSPVVIRFIAPSDCVDITYTLTSFNGKSIGPGATPYKRPFIIRHNTAGDRITIKAKMFGKRGKKFFYGIKSRTYTWKIRIV